MRIAALYDVHGNLPAVEAVLDEIRQSSVDRIVVGGDVVPGPLVAEVLDRLDRLEIPVDWIRGNCESDLLAIRNGRSTSLPPAYTEPYRWLASRLSPDTLRRFDTWPRTRTLAIDGVGSILFCHATSRDDDEIFTRLTPDAEVAAMFEGVQAPLVVCGHTHMQFDRRVGELRIVNAGSVGMPFGEPGAYWLLLDAGAVVLRRTDYDLPGAAERLRRSPYPGAGDFVDRYLLEPPSETRMLEIYSRRPAQ